jgi:hypothetical protein
VTSASPANKRALVVHQNYPGQFRHLAPGLVEQGRKAWQLQGEVVPASEKEPEGWSAADKFTVVLETAGLNATELSAYCRERGLYPEQVERWRQTAPPSARKVDASPSRSHFPPGGLMEQSNASLQRGRQS